LSDKNTVRDLLADEVKDLYSAEKQITKALPKMVRGASDPALKTALTDHLKETQNQVVRLEEIATLLGIKPSGKKCAGMEGIIEEGAEACRKRARTTFWTSALSGRAAAWSITKCRAI
jgi:ferritin-like metal-binding protein YciE